MSFLHSSTDSLRTSLHNLKYWNQIFKKNNFLPRFVKVCDALKISARSKIELLCNLKIKSFYIVCIIICGINYAR